MSQRYFEGAQHAALYAKFRPSAPPQLAQRIISFLKEKYVGELELCCDVGCGNGQCSALFSSSFRQVLATDISLAQVEVAKTLNYPSNVDFQVSPAEKSPAQSGAAQLVVACVAAHWFNLDAFFQETDRILCHNGTVALASYFLPFIAHPTTHSEALNQAIRDFSSISLGSYWGDGIYHVKNEYAEIAIPYKEVVRDVVWTDEESVTLDEFAASLETWSGYQNLCRAKGESAGKEALQDFVTRCQSILGITDDSRDIQLKIKHKYFLVMGRKM